MPEHKVSKINKAILFWFINVILEDKKKRYLCTKYNMSIFQFIETKQRNSILTKTVRKRKTICIECRITDYDLSC